MVNGLAGVEQEPAGSRKNLRTWGSANGQHQAAASNMYEEHGQPGEFLNSLHLANEPYRGQSQHTWHADGL